MPRVWDHENSVINDPGCQTSDAPCVFCSCQSGTFSYTEDGVLRPAVLESGDSVVHECTPTCPLPKPFNKVLQRGAKYRLEVQ